MNGKKPIGLDLRMILTDLAVLDFQGLANSIRVRSLHPGVSFAKVQEQTGFELTGGADAPVTAAPSEEALQIIRTRLDPHDFRATVFKGNPMITPP